MKKPFSPLPSPLPWWLEKHGSIVCDRPKRPDSDDSREFYGGDVVCESISRSDAEFVIAVANATIWLQEPNEAPR